jgi:hypothetical protein
MEWSYYINVHLFHVLDHIETVWISAKSIFTTPDRIADIVFFFTI